MISQLFEIDGLSFQVEAEMSHSSSKDKSECIHPKVTFTLLNNDALGDNLISYLYEMQSICFDYSNHLISEEESLNKKSQIYEKYMIPISFKKYRGTSEKEMMDLVLSLAEQDERIRIVTLEGSRANINIPKDEFQDYDITYFVSDIEPFISNDDWLNQFGNIIMMQKPEDMELFPAEEKGYSYIILFDDYNKIDLTLLPLEELGNYLNDDKLIKIILDKDGRIQQAVVPTDMDYHIRKPSAREYDDCCNEFWNTTTYVIKGLCRKEILFAIDHFNQIVRHELLRMISWKVGIETGFKLSVGKNYKFIERYISEDLWEKLLSTYRMDSYENIWEALFLCHQLFRAVSGEVAERLHYAYPEYDRNITKYTRDMYKKYTGKTGCLDSTYAADIEERREQ